MEDNAELNAYIGNSLNSGSGVSSMQKDFLQIQLEIQKLRVKLFNILNNRTPHPTQAETYLIEGDPLLTKKGIDHLMTIIDSNLDINTLLTRLEKEQIYDILILIMQSIGNAVIFNPEWGVNTFDVFNAIYDSFFTSIFYTLSRALPGEAGSTFKTINDKYQHKILQTNQNSQGGYNNY